MQAGCQESQRPLRDPLVPLTAPSRRSASTTTGTPERAPRMPLETATTISGLVASNPASTDSDSQGADHLRLIKTVLQSTFPAITGPVTGTQVALNALTAMVASPGVLVIPPLGTQSTLQLQSIAGKGAVNVANVGDTLVVQILSDTNTSLGSQVILTQAGNLSVNGSAAAIAVGTGGGVYVGSTPISTIGMIVLLPYGPTPIGWTSCDGTHGTINLNAAAPVGVFYIQRLV